MKNIVFVIESLNLGGAETSLITFLNNLNYKLYHVDLILFVKNSLFIKYVPSEVNIIYQEYPKLSLIERIRYKISKQINSRKLHHAQLFWPIIENKFKIFEKQYDVAHAYNQGFATYYTAKFINAVDKYAWINIDYQKAGYKIQFDYTHYKNYTKVIAISQEVKRGFEEELVKINQKVPTEIIKLFTDEKILHLRGDEKLPVIFDSNKIIIVTVCRLSKQKGLHLAIESCRKLIDKGYSIHWYIVGEGSERQYLEKLIQENQIENEMSLTGVTDNPFPFMNACDIYVQTSLFEGWGLTVIEAALLNKPVVTTNFPTAYDIIQDGKTGLIAEMNSDNIVAQIERYITDKELKEKIIYNLAQRKNKDKEESLAKIERLLAG